MSGEGDPDLPPFLGGAGRVHPPSPAPPLCPSPTARRLIDAASRIMAEAPDRNDFLHTVMCQVGLPRRRTEAKTFERQSGHVSILLEAGKLYNGHDWYDVSLPYGTTPRLVMVHMSSEALRTRSRSVEIGDSMRQFLVSLGISTSGGVRGGYGMFRKQMESLAACRLTLGMHAEGRVVTVDAKPIKRFEAWLQHDGSQRVMWPGVLELSQDFYDTLTDHAVPLDYRALSALKHSALALDVYTWLAHRLRRISSPLGVRLSWENLKDQFGQEYATSKNFKHEFRPTLRQVCTVYPDARLEEVAGGLILYPSKPPIAQTSVSMAGPAMTAQSGSLTQAEGPAVDKAGTAEVVHAESPPTVR